MVAADEEDYGANRVRLSLCVLDFTRFWYFGILQKPSLTLIKKYKQEYSFSRKKNKIKKIKNLFICQMLLTTYSEKLNGLKLKFNNF